MNNIVFYSNCTDDSCSDYFGYSRDNCNFFYYKLKKEFEQNSFTFFTKYNYQPNDNDTTIILFNGLAIEASKMFRYRNLYLLLIESPHVDSTLIDTSSHKLFKKIFTWNDDLIDNKKYFKVNYAFDIPKSIPKQFDNRKLCCVIAGNKSANHPDELYTKRVQFIKWFEKNHLDDFDLYGTEWDQYRFGHGYIGRKLNRIKFLRKKNYFKSYKGLVKSKFETMQNYKFAICYENIKDQSGYITEKIFDCFFAGCIPIYWGAKNITDYIPENCFIDKRKYNSFEEVYNYMSKMDKNTYFGFLDAIEDFLNSDKVDEFRAEVFANTIVSEIVKDLDDNS
ncbi:glycosyltransferase family 10 domain-containing protein [Francisella sp. XLW-1]|uniref:glycosyltransferase family 10 domain-containing protein n=1 Tax=Francisella sp. XLW-1 TaxID=2610887 RepID=UPI00123DDD96|nr:glycosyltransferase family 10 [Francisella sp. XLW-1]